MVSGYHAASEGAGLGKGFLAMLWIDVAKKGELCRASITNELIESVSWLEAGAVTQILFRLEEGRAVGFEKTDERQAEFDNLLKSKDAAVAISASLLLSEGKCLVSPRALALPPPVAAHVTGGSMPGIAWAWCFGAQFELWTDDTRIARTANAIDDLG